MQKLVWPTPFYTDVNNTILQVTPSNTTIRYYRRIYSRAFDSVTYFFPFFIYVFALLKSLGFFVLFVWFCFGLLFKVDFCLFELRKKWFLFVCLKVVVVVIEKKRDTRVSKTREMRSIEKCSFFIYYFPLPHATTRVVVVEFWKLKSHSSIYCYYYYC